MKARPRPRSRHCLLAIQTSFRGRWNTCLVARSLPKSLRKSISVRAAPRADLVGKAILAFTLHPTNRSHEGNGDMRAWARRRTRKSVWPQNAFIALWTSSQNGTGLAGVSNRLRGEGLALGFLGSHQADFPGSLRMALSKAVIRQGVRRVKSKPEVMKGSPNARMRACALR